MQPFIDAIAYREASAHQRRWGTDLIERCRLQGSERILDLGCGDGRLTAELARRVPAGRVVGIDSSPTLLDATRDSTAPNLEFRRVAFEAMTFREEFDVAFSNAALHWVHDQHAVLTAILDALVPGGRTCLQLTGIADRARFPDVVRSCMAEAPFATAFAAFRWPWFDVQPDAYRAMLATVGFVDVEVLAGDVVVEFAGADEVRRWLEQPTLVPFLAVLDPHRRDAFRDLVVARMTAASSGADGVHREWFRRIAVTARKP